MLLGKRRFDNVGTIASGGEIPLFVMLPRAASVVAVDHSYRSLYVTFMKALLFQSMSLPKLRRLTENANAYTPFAEACAKLEHMLPEVLRTKHTMVGTTKNSYNAPITYADYPAIRREIYHTPSAAVWLGLRNLENLTLIHGDLTDLSGYGAPFDLLYVSNATDHTNRTKLYPKLADWSNLIRDGGFLLSTTQEGVDHKDFTKVHSVQGYRTTWIHCLYERKPNEIQTT